MPFIIIMKINDNIKSNIKWAVFFILLCAACAAVWLLRGKYTASYSQAQIYLDSELIRTVRLDSNDMPYEFEVRTDRGFNKIRAEKGRIAVIDSDCPDKICVKQGYISNGAVPIVCLPHRLSVTITGEDNSDIDSVAGKN